jgi:hypothetical protein
VSNALIEAYKQAIEESKKTGNTEDVKRIGEQIAAATDKIVASNQGRDAYQELVTRVTDALVDISQKEIDKLSEVNNSINSASDKLISKL